MSIRLTRVALNWSLVLVGAPVFAAEEQGVDSAAPARREDDALPATETAQFGANPGTPIERGFVFLDGQYRDPPYVVSRQGLAIFINNRLIAPSAPPPADVAARERQIRRVDREKALYEKQLRAGYCLLCFAHGQTIHIAEQNVAYKLPDYIRILRSTESTERKVQQLEQAGWHHGMPAGFLQQLVGSFQAPAELDARLARLAESLCRVDEFGTTAGAPIDEGFVFWNGQYIEAPYVVSRRGLALFVNDTMIQRPSGIQASQPAAAGPVTDPPFPAADLDERTSRSDPLLIEYVGAKTAYISSRFPKEELPGRLKDVYAGLPCVSRAELDPDRPGGLVVTWADGEVSHIATAQFFYGRKPIHMDRESVLKRLEEKRQMFEERLCKGDYYFFSSTGGQLTGGRQAASTILPKLIPVLRSQASIEEKREAATKAGLSLDADAFRPLGTSFSASPQLDRRLAELSATTQPAD